MKIYRCKTCGRVIHEDKRCYHCGGADLEPMAQEIQCHSRAKDAWAQMHRALADRKYDRVASLADQVLEWMGFCSEVYWVRLLAQNQCATDRELICTGCDLRASGNYRSAIEWAGAEEYQVYLDVHDKMEAVRSALGEKMEGYFRQKLVELDLDQTGKALARQAQTQREAIQERMDQLARVEQQIQILAEQCGALMRPWQQALAEATRRAEEASQRISQEKNWNGETYQRHQLTLAAALELSERAVSALEEMTGDHPWKQKYEELKQERTQIHRELGQARGAMEQEIGEAQQKVAEYRDLLEERQAHRELLAVGCFAQIRKLLGEKEMAAALESAGVKM